MIFLVESSQSEYVIFQAACTLKGAIVREWSMLSADQLEELRLYLLQYTANHATYVAIVPTSTCIYKHTFSAIAIEFLPTQTGIPVGRTP